MLAALRDGKMGGFQVFPGAVYSLVLKVRQVQTLTTILILFLCVCIYLYIYIYMQCFILQNVCEATHKCLHDKMMLHLN